MEHQDLIVTLLSVLTNFPLRPEYKDEQRDLQTHIGEVLRSAIPRELTTIISIGPGGPKPSIHLCGTVSGPTWKSGPGTNR